MNQPFSHAQQVSGWTWVDSGGLTGKDFIPLGHMGTQDNDNNNNGNGNGNINGNEFDSHLCYAARPVRVPGEGERLYYMGSNGKHSGSKPHRNASLGLATLRTDHYAGVGGEGNICTRSLRVQQSRITLTVDINAPGGYVRVGVCASNCSATRAVFFDGLSPTDCQPVLVNGIDTVVEFSSGASLVGLRGRDVVLILELHRATVFTVGFRD